MIAPAPFRACIESVKQLQNSQAEVTISPNLFYPGGGGQPCDTGRLSWVVDGKTHDARVLSCAKSTVGGKTLTTESVTIPFQGCEVLAEIDVDRRSALTKAHSAEHVLFQSIQRTLAASKRSIDVKKVDLDVLESSLFVMTPSLSWDDLLRAEKLANDVIKEDRSLVEHQVTKQEFLTEQQKGQQSKYKNIRIKIERIKEDRIRIVEVKDFDYSACAGTHIPSTGMLGNVFVTRFARSGSGEYEIRFKVDTHDALSYAGYARTAAAAAHVNVDQLTQEVQRLIAEQDAIKETMRMAQRQQPLELASLHVEGTREETGNIVLRTGSFSFDDKKILIEKVSSLIAEGEIAVISNKPRNQDQDKNQKQGQDINQSALQLFFFSKSPAIDADTLLRQVAQLIPMKGGGSKTFAAGGTAESYDAVLSALQKLLKTP